MNYVGKSFTVGETHYTVSRKINNYTYELFFQAGPSFGSFTVSLETIENYIKLKRWKIKYVGT